MDSCAVGIQPASKPKQSTDMNTVTQRRESAFKELVLKLVHAPFPWTPVEVAEHLTTKLYDQDSSSLQENLGTLVRKNWSDSNPNATPLLTEMGLLDSDAWNVSGSLVSCLALLVFEKANQLADGLSTVTSFKIAQMKALSLKISCIGGYSGACTGTVPYLTMQAANYLFPTPPALAAFVKFMNSSDQSSKATTVLEAIADQAVQDLLSDCLGQRDDVSQIKLNLDPTNTSVVFFELAKMFVRTASESDNFAYAWSKQAEKGDTFSTHHLTVQTYKFLQILFKSVTQKVAGSADTEFGVTAACILGALYGKTHNEAEKDIPLEDNPDMPRKAAFERKAALAALSNKLVTSVKQVESLSAVEKLLSAASFSVDQCYDDKLAAEWAVVAVCTSVVEVKQASFDKQIKFVFKQRCDKKGNENLALEDIAKAMLVCPSAQSIHALCTLQLDTTTSSSPRTNSSPLLSCAADLVMSVRKHRLWDILFVKSSFLRTPENVKQLYGPTAKTPTSSNYETLCKTAKTKLMSLVALQEQELALASLQRALVNKVFRGHVKGTCNRLVHLPISGSMVDYKDNAFHFQKLSAETVGETAAETEVAGDCASCTVSAKFKFTFGTEPAQTPEEGEGTTRNKLSKRISEWDYAKRSEWVETTFRINLNAVVEPECISVDKQTDERDSSIFTIKIHLAAFSANGTKYWSSVLCNILDTYDTHKDDYWTRAIQDGEKERWLQVAKFYHTNVSPTSKQVFQFDRHSCIGFECPAYSPPNDDTIDNQYQNALRKYTDSCCEHYANVRARVYDAMKESLKTQHDDVAKWTVGLVGVGRSKQPFNMVCADVEIPPNNLGQILKQPSDIFYDIMNTFETQTQKDMFQLRKDLASSQVMFTSVLEEVRKYVAKIIKEKVSSDSTSETEYGRLNQLKKGIESVQEKTKEKMGKPSPLLENSANSTYNPTQLHVPYGFLKSKYCTYALHQVLLLCPVMQIKAADQASKATVDALLIEYAALGFSTEFSEFVINHYSTLGNTPVVAFSCMLRSSDNRTREAKTQKSYADMLNAEFQVDVQNPLTRSVANSL